MRTIKKYIILLILVLTTGSFWSQTIQKPKEPSKKTRTVLKKVDVKGKEKKIDVIRKRQIQRAGHRIKAKKGSADRGDCTPLKSKIVN